MQQFFSLLPWRLFTAQHVSVVFPAIITSSVTAVADSGFTFVSWCVRGRAGPPYHKHSTTITICCHCSHWAPDDGQQNARNIFSCKQTSG